MNLTPILIEHGERFGKLTVLKRVQRKSTGSWLYICGCACGYPKVRATARALMRGHVTACIKCSNFVA